MLASSQLINYNQVSMSIPNIIDKIKSKVGIDRMTILFLFVIMGVGIGSFALGRLSVLDLKEPLNNNEVLGKTDYSLKSDNIVSNDISDFKLIQPKDHRYVASKNGKIYYSIGCSGASRIKPENEVWFSTMIDAEKSGFTQSTSCKY